VTAKTKAREQRRAAAKKKEIGGDDSSMDVDSGSPSPEPAAESKMDVETPTGNESAALENGAGEMAVKKEKKAYAVLENPCRVLAGQEKHILWTYEDEESTASPRYTPVKTGASAATGIVMLRNKRAGEAEEFVEMTTSLQTATTADGDAAASGPANEPNAAPGVDADEGVDDGVVLEPPAPFDYTDEN
jgi:26S proteasome regulatory subunit RPN2 C-terminal domain